MTEIKKEEATVNGFPVTSLSPAGQGFFDKILSLKREADELAAQFQLQQAGATTLKAMLDAGIELSENETIQEYLLKRAQELDGSAQQLFQQHEQKQGALKEISAMITTEIDQAKEAQAQSVETASTTQAE